MSVLKQLRAYISTRTAPRHGVDRLVRRGFPSVALPTLEFLVTGKCSSDVHRVRAEVEAVRAGIAAAGEGRVDILYSPRPGTSGNEPTPASRPAHGEILRFTMKQVASTGKNARWGTALHILARTARARTILELGSCAGISGCYLACAPECERFVTVEGSAELAALAKANLAEFKARARVYNLLFDDALDEILPELRDIDFVFIDGHHEKVATIHYWQRIMPNVATDAIVVFDDVSWSRDMREAWIHLAREQGFSDAIDFGSIGVCLWNGGADSTRYWDLQRIVGRRRIGDPHGWK